MADHPLILSPINRSPSLYESVSEQLLSAIREAKLQPGAKIPSERELGVQFGVSRTVIREAIRHLAAKGVLEVQSGSGVQVAHVGHQGISESIDLYLRQRGPLEPQKIHEVRESLEIRTVALAATRATEQDLEAIGAACDLMESALNDPELSSEADLEFHRAIAAASGNQLFVVLLDSLSDVLIQIRRATLGDPQRGAVALAAHRKIAAALISRDEQAAIDSMREHLTDSLETLTRTVHATQ